MDNYGTHKHPRVRAWFARRPRFHVHFTPTYASWLNQVERWFGLIKVPSMVADTPPAGDPITTGAIPSSTPTETEAAPATEQKAP